MFSLVNHAVDEGKNLGGSAALGNADPFANQAAEPPARSSSHVGSFQASLNLDGLDYCTEAVL